MSKFDEALAKYQEDLNGLGGYDADLLKAVAKGLGPSIYNSDSKLVAASDKAELERVKQNFLIKKLGLSESDGLDEALAATAEKYNKRAKYRAVFYYLLVKHFGKESVYA
jgi:hypothetical protein